MPEPIRRGQRFVPLNSLVDYGHLAALTPSAAMVWVCLFRHVSGRTGTARLSQERIAEQTGVSLRAVKDAVKVLQDRGLLHLEHRGGNGRGLSVWRLLSGADTRTGKVQTATEQGADSDRVRCKSPQDQGREFLPQPTESQATMETNDRASTEFCKHSRDTEPHPGLKRWLDDLYAKDGYDWLELQQYAPCPLDEEILGKVGYKLTHYTDDEGRERLRTEPIRPRQNRPVQGPVEDEPLPF